MKKILQQVNNPAVLVVLISAVLLGACNPASHITAVTTEKDIIKAVDSSQWSFTPNQVIPQYGRARQLTSGYTVEYRNNKLTVYLPYYGRAYGGADVLSGRGPLDFKSLDFTANRQQPKDGEWKITFIPKDQREVQSMNFVLYSNGSAHLDITMTNRSAVSYQGSIAPAK
jgi:Domain of unknown function (DUF4251)